MRPFLIVKLEILFQPLANLSQALISFRINLLVFHAPPEPFDEYIVQCPALAVHTDLDPTVFKPSCKLIARKLDPLIRVENLRRFSQKPSL